VPIKTKAGLALTMVLLLAAQTISIKTFITAVQTVPILLIITMQTKLINLALGPEGSLAGWAYAQPDRQI
jgi:hypothetical protein